MKKLVVSQIFLLFIFSSSLCGQYDKVVIIGASIVEFVYDSDINTPNTERTNQWNQNGVNVDVYGYGFNGSTIDEIIPRVETAMTVHPSNTLFMVHIGGNNVTQTRPYVTASQSELQGISDDYDALFASIPMNRRDDVIIMPLTFRLYNPAEDLVNNQELGSLPYNQDILIPKIAVNAPQQMNIDGNPIIDLYNFTLQNFDTYFDLNDNDGIHPSPEGEDLLSDFMSLRAAYFINGGAIPEPLTSNIAVSGVDLNEELLEIETGDTINLIATVTPDNATNTTVEWASSNSLVAIVNNEGLVTTLTSGSTTITATTLDGGFTDTVIVNVSNDSDGDGIIDNVEINNGTDENDPCDPLQNSGYTNYKSNNSIWSIADCDGDGVSNGDEDMNETDPYQISGDTDGDGIVDDVEINLGTDINNPCDPVQVVGYTGYNSINSTWAVADCDGDGDLNADEDASGTDPYDSNSFIDTDNDGIRDENDNCPATYNPGQDDFDNDGFGDVCDTDIDNDGIFNEQDLCETTPKGTMVGQDGCEIFLGTDNFIIKTIGESCIDSDNGSIEVSAKVLLDYVAILSNSQGDEIESQEFNTELTFIDLATDSYTLCFTIKDFEEYQQCFNLNIQETEPLNVSASSSLLENKLNLRLSGSTFYTIELNDKVYTTGKNEITLPLSEGENLIKVSTAKDCQGSYEKIIVLDTKGHIYPNPLGDDDLNIYIGPMGNEIVQLNIFDSSGAEVLSQSSESDKNGYLKANLSLLGEGIYFLTVTAKNTLVHYKVIKK